MQSFVFVNPIKKGMLKTYNGSKLQDMHNFDGSKTIAEHIGYEA